MTHFFRNLHPDIQRQMKVRFVLIAVALAVLAITASPIASFVAGAFIGSTLFRLFVISRHKDDWRQMEWELRHN